MARFAPIAKFPAQPAYAPQIPIPAPASPLARSFGSQLSRVIDNLANPCQPAPFLPLSTSFVPLPRRISATSPVIQGTLVYSTDSGGDFLDGKFSLLIGGHLLEGTDPDVPEFGPKSPKGHQYFYRSQNGDPLLDGAPVQEAYYLFAFLFPISPPIIPDDPNPAPKVLDVNPPGLDAWSLVVSSGSYGYFGVGDIDFVEFSINSVNVSAVDSAPEPATLSIWCLGALGSAAIAYRRGRKPR